MLSKTFAPSLAFTALLTPFSASKGLQEAHLKCIWTSSAGRSYTTQVTVCMRQSGRMERSDDRHNHEEGLTNGRRCMHSSIVLFTSEFIDPSYLRPRFDLPVVQSFQPCWFASPPVWYVVMSRVRLDKWGNYWHERHDLLDNTDPKTPSHTYLSCGPAGNDHTAAPIRPVGCACFGGQGPTCPWDTRIQTSSSTMATLKPQHAKVDKRYPYRMSVLLFRVQVIPFRRYAYHIEDGPCLNHEGRCSLAEWSHVIRVVSPWPDISQAIDFLEDKRTSEDRVALTVGRLPSALNEEKGQAELYVASPVDVSPEHSTRASMIVERVELCLTWERRQRCAIDAAWKAMRDDRIGWRLSLIIGLSRSYQRDRFLAGGWWLIELADARLGVYSQQGTAIVSRNLL
ncbi:hypothetical protein AG1IA_08227 [Rhizoctonia solani AG-1 IA]|uniref:Uncharacterized protein n=1 Tax=Thanatephorus cucumeris (strain AG1-IA) TaxID=983506 RepID=L8WLU2_THACA|nr:hypothetical protein AG1IA_08227 [Rhizoctonia solani AG-1 IA]